MIGSGVKRFIEENTFCHELLFEDWEAFLNVLYAEGGRVESILWWDHCKLSEQGSSVGMGGYKDPHDPDYMYAETQLFQDGFASVSLEEIKERINRQREEGLQYDGGYKSHDLMPSFYLVNNEGSLILVHRFCTSNEADLAVSEVCGCFYCMKIYSPSEITNWINDSDGKTAVCPHCGIDSVLPGNRVELSKDFLKKMHEVWF
jgi:hypothetical protein